jgi:long-chain acyl-CoA synthetase
VHKGIKEKFQAQPKKKQRLVAIFSALALLYHQLLAVSRGLLVLPKGKRAPSLLRRGVAAVGAAMLWPLARLGDKLIWHKVRQALGGRQKLIVSGGSALAGFLEAFYRVAGIMVSKGARVSGGHLATTDRGGPQILSGYGLTETAPVIAVRRADRNCVDGGVVGKPPGQVELRVRSGHDVGMPERELFLDDLWFQVVDAETGEPRGAGVVGVVHTRGPQVGGRKAPIVTLCVSRAHGACPGR